MAGPLSNNNNNTDNSNNSNTNKGATTKAKSPTPTKTGKQQQHQLSKISFQPAVSDSNVTAFDTPSMSCVSNEDGVVIEVRVVIVEFVR